MKKRSRSKSYQKRGSKNRHGHSATPERKDIKLKKIPIDKLYKSPFREITDIQISSKAAGQSLTKALKK
jgi:hypothetical protein